jgi:hypothetical protein
VFGEVGYQCISKPNPVAGSLVDVPANHCRAWLQLSKGQMSIWEQGHPSVSCAVETA